MTTERFANQASTTLSASLGAGDLTLSVQSVAHFPVLPEFRIRIGQELLLVTGVAGATWTVTRGIEGTTAADHISGTAVVGVLTAGGLDELRTEIERDALPTPPIITNSGSAAAGDVVRLVSAGVLAKAQADSVPHASATIGIWDGIQVVPFSAQPIVTFDSTPVVGQPCYLSSTLAGALTSTAPASGALSVPPDLIVLQNYTVGVAYKARVGKSASIVSSLGIEQQLIANSAALIGVIPSSLHSKFDDFNTLPATGYPAFGAVTYFITPGTHINQTPAASHVDFSSSNGAYPEWTVSLGTPCSIDPNLLVAAALSAQKWALTFKVKTIALGVTFKMWLDRGLGNETCGFGISGLSPDKFVFLHANKNWYAAEVLPGEYTEIGVPDTLDHVICMYSTGDGNVHFKFDNNPEVIAAMPVSASPVVPRWFMVTEGGATFDYWAFCSI